MQRVFFRRIILRARCRLSAEVERSRTKYKKRNTDTGIAYKQNAAL
jgi:hypothetical protein